MILHRILLKNFRGVVSQEVEFEARGVHVIEGPNEAGKSSILEAFELLRKAKPTSSAQAVKQVAPVGRDEPPFVEAEFTVAGERMIYRKRWLKKPLAEVEFPESVKTPLTSGEAHDYVTDVLDSDVDLSLWEALRIVQDTVTTQLDTSKSLATLRSALDAAADGGTSVDDDLIARARDESEKYWTPTLKEGKVLKDADARLEAARRAFAEASARRDELDAAVAEHERAAWDAQRKREAVAERRLEREALEKGRAVVRDLAESLKRVVGHRRVAEVEREAAAGRAEERRVLIRRVEAVRATLDEAEKDVADIDTRLEQAEREVEEAARAVAAAERDRDEAQRRLAEARARQEAERLAAERAELEKTAGEIAAIDEELKAVETERDSEKIDEAVRSDIARASEELQTALVRQSARAPRATVEGAGTVTIGADDVRADEGWSGEIVEDTRFAVGDVAITVSPPVDTESVRTEVRAARTRLDDLLGSVGADSFEDVERRFARTGELSRRAFELRAQREGLLRGRTPEEIRERLGAIGEVTSASEPEEEALDPAALEETVARLDDAVVTCREAEREKAAAAGVLKEQKANRQGRLERARSQAETDVAALDAAREAASDEDIDREVAEKEAALVAARDEAEALQQSYDRAVAEAPPEEVEYVENLIASLDGEIADLDVVVHTAKARIDFIVAEGRHEDLEQARAELDQEERAHAALYRRARAAKRLFTTLSAHRGEALRRYQAPFREAVEELGAMVFGAGFEVSLDDDLTITERRLDGETVPYSALSSGAREQLSIIARVACARLVGDSGVPVFLDDTLGYTDPSRRRGMGRVLSACGDATQVVVLTCDSSRFNDVVTSRRVRLT